MEQIWRDVFVDADAVVGDGFTAEVGAAVTMALTLHCERWAAASIGEPDGARWRPGRYADGRSAGRTTVVGTAIAAGGISGDGWILDVGGLPLYVLAGPGRSAGSAPAGTRLCAAGRLAAAEDHVVSGFEPTDEVRGRAERQWRVRRILRLERAHATSGHLIGIETRAVRHRDIRGRGQQAPGVLLDLAPL